jgi:hypothetical protein
LGEGAAAGLYLDDGAGVRVDLGTGAGVGLDLDEETRAGLDLGEGIGSTGGLSTMFGLGGDLGLGGELGLGGDTDRELGLGFEGGRAGGLSTTLGLHGALSWDFLPGFFATNISLIGLPSVLVRLLGPAACSLWIRGRLLAGRLVSEVGLKPLLKVWVSVVGSNCSTLATFFQPNDSNIPT